MTRCGTFARALGSLVTARCGEVQWVRGDPLVAGVTAALRCKAVTAEPVVSELCAHVSRCLCFRHRRDRRDRRDRRQPRPP